MPTLNYRLDDFVQQFGLPFPNHIKIDVDGIEYEVLKGAQETLSSPELRSVLMEINEERGDADEIRELIQKSGFVMESEVAGGSLYCRKDVLV